MSAESARKLTEVQEEAWNRAMLTGAMGAAILFAGALGFYMSGVIMPGIVIPRIIMAVVVCAGALVVVNAISKAAGPNTLPRYEFVCPYCGYGNLFIGSPAHNFSCDNCNREIYFVEGTPVSVWTVVCQVCSAEHRVATSVQQFVCDKCNRPLNIIGATGEPHRPVEPERFNVVLKGAEIGRRDEIASMLQSIMAIDLPSAHSLLDNVGPLAPLTVAEGLAREGADAIARQLTSAGASALVNVPEGA